MSKAVSSVLVVVMSCGVSFAESALRRSDVVFMYDNPAMYEPYGCSVMGWAGRAQADHIDAARAKGVRLFSCSVGLLTEFKRVIDFDENFLDAACRNFAGEPFIVPWLWDHKYKNQPAYWWCTNSPLYRRYLLGRLDQVIPAGPSGLHVDDYRGTSGSVTWRSGGFCRHCMKAFRDYLSRHVDNEKLAGLGITDLEGFDYREFLLRQGIKPEDYNKRRPRLPLADEFYTFHVMAANEWVKAYHQRAVSLSGKPMTLSVNSGLSNPHALVAAPHLSYFCCEVPHQAAQRACPASPAYIYKLAEGLGRPVASTASGHDWAFINEHKLYGLVRTWIALSYAYGHHLMAPHRQWCYTKEKGTHWANLPTSDLAFMYRFVREQAGLFDGYEALAPVAVVYSSAARRKGQGGIKDICMTLAERNIPFAVVVAGDEWVNDRMAETDLAAFRAVMVPDQLILDERQRARVDDVRRAGKLVEWPNEDRLKELVPAPVVLAGAQRVWVVPRRKPSPSGDSLVLHLLNRNYDAEQDDVTVQRDFHLSLRRDVLGCGDVKKADLYAPDAKNVSLPVTAKDNNIDLRIPELGVWGIVELY